jgi:4-aminobutyrate aminotransferase
VENEQQGKESMISEQELEALSFSGAPNIISDVLPGPTSAAMLEEAPKYESMTRGGGRFPLVFDKGKGVTVLDPDGNLYIDMSAGVAVNSVGRAHPDVIAAIERQSKVLMHGSDISNTKRGELAKKLASVAPPGLRDNSTAYFTQSGSGAVESAVKFAKRITGKHQIIAFHGAYHGTWHAANSLTTGDQYRAGYEPFMAGVIHLPYQYCYRCPFGLKRSSCGMACAVFVEHVLNTPYTAADNVAAVIIGLMIGVELVANRQTGEPISPDKTGAIVGAMLQRGVIMVPCGRYGNVLRLMPSLTIPRSYLDASIDIMLDVLRHKS